MKSNHLFFSNVKALIVEPFLETCAVINFLSINVIFSVTTSKIVPLPFLVITQEKKPGIWDTMGAVGLDNLVRANGIGYESTFSDMVWLF